MGKRDESVTSSDCDLQERRGEGIQTLRGVAIALIVLGHAMFLHRLYAIEYGVPPAPGGTWLDRFFELGVDVRMPLFAMISGFVYAYRPVLSRDLRQFFRGKARRLLIPLLVVTVIEFFFMGYRIERAAEPSFQISDHFLSFLAVPKTHLWFLYAMLWIFALVAVLDAFKAMSTPLRWGIGLGIVMAIQLQGIPVWGHVNLWGVDIPNVLGYAGAVYLAPFFFLGLGLSRFGKQLVRFEVALVMAAVLVARVGWSMKASGGFEGVAALATGMAACYLLIYFGRGFEPLSRLGNYSYTIYLYHGYGIFLAYEASLLLGAHPPFWAFLFIGTFGGIVLPIFFQKVVLPLPVANTLFLGFSPTKAR